MKNRIIILAAVAATMTLSSCSTALKLSSSANYQDDLYATHDINQVKAQELKRQERDLARREAAFQREQAVASAAVAQYESDQGGNPYNSILSDNYEESYERRLRGFKSSTYKMPSSYSDARYSSSAHYASAYDPAFYNVMVMGDQVWVEPKYVSSMFGNWGGATNINMNLSLWGYSAYPYGNWGYSPYPYHNWWGSPYYNYGWDGGWGPYGNGWGYPYYGHGPSWGYPYYPAWGGSYSKYNDKNTVFNRPRNGSTISTPSYPGGANGSTVNYRRGASVPSSSSIGNGSSVQQNNGSYRRPTTTTTRPTTTNQNNNSSIRRPATVNYNNDYNNNNSTNNSFRSGSSNNNFGGSSSFGGSSGGGSRSGGSGVSGGASSGGGYRR